MSLSKVESPPILWERGVHSASRRHYAPVLLRHRVNTVFPKPVTFSLWQDSATGETIEPLSAFPSVTEGYSYCTANWQAEDSLFSSPFARRRSRRLQDGIYTAPELPDVIPEDVLEVCLQCHYVSFFTRCTEATYIRCRGNVRTYRLMWFNGNIPWYHGLTCVYVGQQGGTRDRPVNAV